LPWIVAAKKAEGKHCVQERVGMARPSDFEASFFCIWSDFVRWNGPVQFRELYQRFLSLKFPCSLSIVSPIFPLRQDAVFGEHPWGAKSFVLSVQSHCLAVVTLRNGSGSHGHLPVQTAAAHQFASTQFSPACNGSGSSASGNTASLTKDLLKRIQMTQIATKASDNVNCEQGWLTSDRDGLRAGNMRRLTNSRIEQQ